MTYRLKIPRTVRSEIERLPGNVRPRPKRTNAGLACEPRPANAKMLHRAGLAEMDSLMAAHLTPWIADACGTTPP